MKTIHAHAQIISSWFARLASYCRCCLILSCPSLQDAVHHHSSAIDRPIAVWRTKLGPGGDLRLERSRTRSLNWPCKCWMHSVLFGIRGMRHAKKMSSCTRRFDMSSCPQARHRGLAGADWCSMGILHENFRFLSNDRHGRFDHVVQ